MNFTETLMAAKQNDSAAKERLLKMYNPYILKSSMINNCFDEDLYQNLAHVFLKCINSFLA